MGACARSPNKLKRVRLPDLRSCAPETVADDKNFAMAPIFRPILDVTIDPISGKETPRHAKEADELKAIRLAKLLPGDQKMPFLPNCLIRKGGSL